MFLPVIMYGCESWTINKGEHWRIDTFELWCWRRLESLLDWKEIKPVNSKGNRSWIFTGRTDVEPENPILWPPDVKNWFFGKDPNAGEDWRQEEKGKTEDEMVRWHHWLNGHEFEQAPGFGDGQGNLACCSPWDHKELDLTERLNWIDLNPVLCDDLEVGIWEMGGSFKREEIHVYFWLIHIKWQKATHIVKQFFMLFSC